MIKTYNFNQLLSIFFLVGIIGVFSSCKDDEGQPAPTAQEEATAKLTSSPWKLDRVTVDGINQTDVYKNLTVSFTGSAFSSTNGGVVWPANGSWTFQNQEATLIKRSDDVEITIQTLTDQSLMLSFYWEKNTLRNARVSSIQGQHVFTFVK